ncbi:hypothetical protein GSI_08340 [Ganoderma sinense ZZ0214-1]|uniref:O-methyltransferase C-terminal domain-containing protein n=1 Tax=Ganoderma sinense ZZ0214-1 TaxID=1077348 RepID=A0A2G8S6X6_9APHY|nr:hypothetical protein GSI_08340 [Ganoderma sinense ZZ0214-1]
MTFATLRALHAVIGTAIDDIERVYIERSPQGDTLEYPSLDEPYYHTAQHTPEEELAEALKDDPAVAAASKRIVAACAQLSTTVNKPWFRLMEDVMWAQFSSAIGFLEAANIVEILREAGPGGLHVQEILRLVLELRTNSKTAAPPETVPLTPVHLSHILRLLATGHYLCEVTPDVFANNRASSYIDSGKTLSQLRQDRRLTTLTTSRPEKKYNNTDGVAAYVGVIADTDFDYRAQPPPELFGQPAEDAVNGGGNTPYATLFNFTFNTQLDFFSWLELPENEGRLMRFGHAMAGSGQCEAKDAVLQGFSWEELPQGAVLVDVGGGIGSQAMLVAQTHPHIHAVVEDREQVVSTAASAWGPQYAHLLESGRVSWRTRDFFQAWSPLDLPDLGLVDVPAVFLLRLVMHDWKDEDCNRILTRLRAAAGPDTKLLIGDMLLQHACATDAEYAAADGSGATFPFVTKDSPLMPNLGVANILGYFMDLFMMGVFDAKERTANEMAALTLSAGWKIVEVRRAPGSIWAYTTAVPV